MAAAITTATAARVPGGGSCSARMRRASGTDSNGTRHAAITATRRTALATGRPATSASTQQATAKVASIAAVRVAAPVSDAARAIP
ncbi:MAG TPA: hypothetical protein VKV35_02895 [Streptosporangiaceae bacterium]|nr:hypothetical protein [Streptosporangiaceae bacterium]